MMDNTVSYRLTCSLVTLNNGVSESNVYEHIIRVRFLKKTGEKATVYNRELDMYFNDKSALSIVYELEISKVRLFLSPRLGRASEFLRATYHRYDWMQLFVRLTGKPVSINNKEELKQRWVKMKQKLKENYIGGVVDNYFDKLDKQFITDGAVLGATSQYFYFGLVFPQIPMNHPSGWSQKRMIELSEYEEEFFEEQITHSEAEGNIDNYFITGNVLPDSRTTLLKYQGYISKKKIEILPETASIDISFQRSSIITQWNFKLQRVQL